MQNIFSQFISLSILIACINLVLVFLYNLLFLGRIKIWGFKYSRLKYFLLAIPLYIPIIIVAIDVKSFYPILLYLTFAVLGVLGETGFSMWWGVFFKHKFWEYKEDVINKGDSSYLNFIIWGWGVFFLITVSRILSRWLGFKLDLSFFVNYWPIFAVILFVILVVVQTISGFRKKELLHFVKDSISYKNYLLFCLPIFLPFTYLLFKFSFKYLVFFVSLGIILFVAEYIIGKLFKLFLSKKLWVYNYETLNHKHTTLLNIIPFGLATFYFLTLYSLFNYFLSF